ncbi:beta-ketoacyl synthase N-terminal-like domain-containing protein [Streptomyces sp. NPDC041068]|uniref:type I polyketide synthase n=1 Tax=Streptomyces sp. NPDC041068 TaxID=3155130 RepID=UPI0033DC5E10
MRQPHPENRTVPVAVIGMACRFPGARNADEFWRNLVEGRDAVTRVTGPRGIAARGLLDDPERFDADYFGMSPREARLVNPQHRAFLECAVEALENAGVDAARHPGTVGVYGGGSDNAYAHVLAARRAQKSPVSAYEIRMGNGADFLCSRVAYKLGLRGPTVAVQAGCATSLVSVHLAVQGLLAGDCDLALAGGATVRFPFVPDEATEAGIQAPDGVCRAFDAEAGGAVGADGVGLVVLKRLDRALADGDRIDAVVLGSAVNNDGADRMGFAAPGVEGQAAVIEAAQRAADIDPATCTYVEAHGTGTPLGDPVEIAALTKAFRRGGERGAPCAIGSVKTGIGHTDAAAGAAGLIKTVLALKHGLLPPSLHFTTPNPHIDFGASPFRVVTQLREWRPEGMPRRAGVSSFSLGGTNAHVVLEQPPTRETAPPPGRSWHILPLSAKTPAALEQSVARLAEHLRVLPGTPAAGLAWTLQTGRTEHPRRRFAVVDGVDDAVRVLSGELPERLVGTADTDTETGVGAPKPVVFRCTPVTGADAARERDAAAQLYAAEPTFRSAVDACAVGDVFEGAAPARIVGFATRYALAQLWRRRGVAPASVSGEGVAGVLAAAVVAGVFDAAEAGRLLAKTAEKPQQLEESVQLVGPRAPELPLWVAREGMPARVTSDEAVDPAYWATLLGRPDTSGDEQDSYGAQDSYGMEASSGVKDSSGVEAPYSVEHRTGARGPRGIALDLCVERTPTDERAALDAVGRLWLAGAPVDWAALHDATPERVALPAYPFAGERYTVETDDAFPATAQRPGPSPATSPEPLQETTPASAPTPTGDSGNVDQVAALFAEILELPCVEPDESFFDLGGDSLIAAKLVARAHEVFSVELVPRTLFQAPTAQQLAALIAERLTAQSAR